MRWSILLFVAACGDPPNPPIQNQALAPATVDDALGVWTGSTATLTLRLQIDGAPFRLDATAGDGARIYTGTLARDATSIRLSLDSFSASEQGNTVNATVVGASLCIGDLCTPQELTLSATIDGDTLACDLGPLLIGSGASLPVSLKR